MSESRKTTRQERIIKEREELYKEEQIFTPNNKVWVKGTLEGEFEYSHKSGELKFYKNRIEAKRENMKNSDFIPIMITENELPKEPVIGKRVEAGGYFYSCSRCGGKYKDQLKLYLHCKKLNFCEEETSLDENAIYLYGMICKPPIYRKTLVSNKTIADIMLTVKRERKLDLIPCIAWNDEAEYVNTLNQGNMIKVYGRIQSRTYPKRPNPDSIEVEERDVYEISIMDIKKSDEEEE